MGAINQPDNLGKLIDALDARIRALEVSARVGLGYTRTAWATAAVSPATYGAWESGAAGSTWTDDQGNTGAGYCELTMETGSRALVLFGARVIDVGSNGTAFRSSSAVVGFGFDGLTPDLLPGLTGQRSVANGNTQPVDANVLYSIVRNDLTPGVNVFRAWAKWTDTVPSGSIVPRMTDTVITVIPLNPA